MLLYRKEEKDCAGHERKPYAISGVRYLRS